MLIPYLEATLSEQYQHESYCSEQSRLSRLEVSLLQVQSVVHDLSRRSERRLST